MNAILLVVAIGVLLLCWVVLIGRDLYRGYQRHRQWQAARQRDLVRCLVCDALTIPQAINSGSGICKHCEREIKAMLRGERAKV